MQINLLGLWGLNLARPESRPPFIVPHIALSQSVHIAHFVNDLSKNVILALGIQDIDSKLEQTLHTLKEIIQYLGDEVQGLKLRSHLEYHVEYQSILPLKCIMKVNEEGTGYICILKVPRTILTFTWI